MAGGRGSRFGSALKPFLRVCGRTVLERVVAVARRVSERVVVALSPYTLPAATGLCPGLNVDACIELPGSGYPHDMRLAAEIVKARPLLFLPADTPFLDPRKLEGFIEEALATGAGLVTLEAGDRGPLGISLLAGGFEPWTSIRKPWGPDLLNINTPKDLAEAERLCRAWHNG
jgi:adenosylcobinamide-phosphate guanylyltransferase